MKKKWKVESCDLVECKVLSYLFFARTRTTEQVQFVKCHQAWLKESSGCRNLSSQFGRVEEEDKM